MSAERLEHLQTTDTTHLTRPDLHLYRGSEYPWRVQSLRGKVLPGGQQVELLDEVRVARTDAKGRPTILTSSHLSVFPEREYAETRYRGTHRGRQRRDHSDRAAGLSQGRQDDPAGKRARTA